MPSYTAEACARGWKAKPRPTGPRGRGADCCRYTAMRSWWLHGKRNTAALNAEAARFFPGEPPAHPDVLLRQAIKRLHPAVQAFCIGLMRGDRVGEARLSAGLSELQVQKLMPRLRMLLA